jgi:hypothetical protein
LGQKVENSHVSSAAASVSDAKASTLLVLTAIDYTGGDVAAERPPRAGL